MSADKDAIGQLSILYNDAGKVICKGIYTGTKEGRIWLQDDSGRMNSFPADKYDLRPSKDA